jgi:heme a synthase
MVILGGITRLTGSGLSIVEWKPVTGIVPPLNQKEWLLEFAQYQQYPEYKKLNYGISLLQFKQLYLWEYLHRMLGRLMGIIFIVPFVIFYFKGLISKKIAAPLLVIFLLGGLQGFMGWYMVKSGLDKVPHVSHFRLTAHQGIALLLAALLFWIMLSMSHQKNETTRKPSTLLVITCVSLTLLITQIILGSFVAGLKAGFSYNNFPFMGENFFPSAMLTSQPFFYNGVVLQFVHRWFAFFVVLSMVVLFYLARPHQELHSLAKWLLVLVILQIALGIATLMMHVPIVLGVAHQFVAITILLLMVRILHITS